MRGDLNPDSSYKGDYMTFWLWLWLLYTWKENSHWKIKEKKKVLRIW